MQPRVLSAVLGFCLVACTMDMRGNGGVGTPGGSGGISFDGGDDVSASVGGWGQGGSGGEGTGGDSATPDQVGSGGAVDKDVVEIGGSGGAGGSAAGGGGSGGIVIGGGGGSTGPACPSGLAGPSLTLVKKPGAGGHYCIDSTEVTAKQYHTWLNSLSNKTPKHDADCAWNETYSPEKEYECDLSIHGNASKKPNWPMVCIDWCDARDYCVGVGKRLCGKIGGGPLGYNSAVEPAISEWANACTGGVGHLFPYGNTHVEKVCVDDQYDKTMYNGSTSGAPEDVGTAKGCKVNEYPTLMDMSGNVWEWTDSCGNASTPAESPCRDLGGSFWDYAGAHLSCASDSPSNHTRSLLNKNVGFRCCVDAL